MEYRFKYSWICHAVWASRSSASYRGLPTCPAFGASSAVSPRRVRCWASQACGCRLDPSLSAGVSNVLREIEQVLVREFARGGSALFQQRFVDLRARPTE